MAGQRWRMVIEKDRIDRTRVDRYDEPALGEGEIEVALRRFALTANNVSYAVLGRSFGSFSDMPGCSAFFPTGSEDHGHLPVWGFAEITDSNCDELPLGERLFGFFALASHLVMRPSAVTR